MPDLHPDLAVLAPLLGTWAGEGTGDYPTIDAFGYVEEVTFGHVGKPFLAYGQRTRSTADDRPLHAETGYLRVSTPGRLELVLAHPSGISEIAEGSLVEEPGGALIIDVATTVVGRTSSAKEVSALRRRLRLDGDVLSYELDMAAVGQPLQHHLRATLHRTG
jgi:hypothetical protein